MWYWAQDGARLGESAVDLLLSMCSIQELRGAPIGESTHEWGWDMGRHILCETLLSLYKSLFMEVREKGKQNSL